MKSQKRASYQRVDFSEGICGKIEGEHAIKVHPRASGKKILKLFPGSRLTVKGKGQEVYVCLPIMFISPGPGYKAVDSAAQIRCRVDDEPWQSFHLFRARRIMSLGRQFENKEHEVIVEPIGEMGVLEGLIFSETPLCRVQTYIMASQYNGLLTDVYAEVFHDGELVYEDYMRNPQNGSGQILDLVPGKYRAKIHAFGWKSLESKEFEITEGQEMHNLSLLLLDRDPRFGPPPLSIAPSFGRSLNVSPGETFTCIIPLGEEPNFSLEPPVKYRMVSRFKSFEPKVEYYRRIDLGEANGLAEASFQVPADVPHDMYDLQVHCMIDGELVELNLTQAVCVREKLPEHFYLAGIGHMNTWGQKPGEYLRKVCEMAQLGNARMILIGNEVNAAYISGALGELRIPYAITSGNHTMARWKDFYGPNTIAIDDGPLRVVVHSARPYESWADAERLLKERKDATCRILLSFEGYAPLEMIKEQGVHLIFDAHSHKNQERMEALEDRMHFRAPNQQSMRWISMTSKGLDPLIKTSKDVPVLKIPREGPVPFRSKFSAPNDGTASEMHVQFINEYDLPFPEARVRLVLKNGEYEISGGKVLQAFTSDDEKVRIIDVQTSVPAKNNQIQIIAHLIK